MLVEWVEVYGQGFSNVDVWDRDNGAFQRQIQIYIVLCDQSLLEDHEEIFMFGIELVSFWRLWIALSLLLFQQL